MENKSHAFLAGLFTIGLLAATLAAVWWLGGSREQTDIYWLEARGNVTGLNPQAQVRYRGIRAGKVRSIQTDPDDPMLLLVEIGLDARYRLTDKTIARLNQQGITGLAYVMLEEPEAGGRPLDPAAKPPPRIFVQPGMLDSLTKQGEQIARQVSEMTGRLNRLLDDANLQRTARTLDGLARTADELPRMAADLRGLFSVENRRRFSALLSHLEKTAGEAAPLTAEARALVQSMNALAGRLERLSQTGETLGGRVNAETLPRLESLLTEATATARRLDHLLDTLADTPQAVLFGLPPGRPGPGEAGFTAPMAGQPVAE